MGRFFLRLLLSIVVLVVGALILLRLASAVRESSANAEAAPLTGRFVEVAGQRIFIQEAGPVDSPAVLLIHGTAAWSEIWRPTMHALARAGYRAIALDLPPFGFSDRPDPANYTDTAQAARINGVIDALGLRSVVLVGHSLGSRPTVEAVLRQPDRVRLLVLVDAALDPKTAPVVNAKAPLPLRFLLSSSWLRDPFISATATNPVFTRKLYQKLILDPAKATDQQVAMVQRQFHVKGTTHAVGEWIEEIGLGTAPALDQDQANYARLTMPVQLIWGREDAITPLPRGEALQKMLPHAELAVLDHTGHIPAVENEVEFDRVLVEFLSQHRLLTP